MPRTSPLRPCLVRRAARAAILLLFAVFPADAIGQEPFHTDPSCWNQPRLYHAGPPPAELANRLHLLHVPTTEPGTDPTVSPNGAYRFWVRQADTSGPAPWGAGIVVDRERDRNLALLIEEIAGPVYPRWINEKLIYVRIQWGRITFTDLILDVETAELTFHEVVRDGTLAFEQFQAGCNGDCPCAPTVDESAEPAEPSPSLPSADAPIGLLELPTVFGPPEQGGLLPAENPEAVPVYDAPSLDATLLAELVEITDFEVREFTYEGGAAVVHEETDGWYRIGIRAPLPGGHTTAWIPAGRGGKFHSVPDLVIGSLAYLTGDWDGYVWSQPGGGRRSGLSPLKRDRPGDGRFEAATRVLEGRTVDGGLWLRVETYLDPCGGDRERAIDRGWIPAYDIEGELVVWFHSRGC